MEIPRHEQKRAKRQQIAAYNELRDEKAGNINIRNEPDQFNPLGAKVNEVWFTNSNHLALIVDRPSANEGNKGFLWFDQTSQEWTVSPILNRLKEKTDYSPGDFFFNYCEKQTEAWFQSLNITY